MRSLKRFVLSLTLLALVLAGGCTPEGETPAEGTGVSTPTAELLPTDAESLPTAEPADDFSGVTIRFVSREDGRTGFEALAQEFHELNPSIRVEFVALEDVSTADDEILDCASYLHQLVSAADTVNASPCREAVSQGLLRDLAPFIEADASFEPDDFFPGMLEAFRWDGGTWALPSHARLFLVFYNRQLFDEGGVPYPSPEWTRDGFLAAAQALTVRQGDEVVRYGFLDTFGGATAFVRSEVAGLAEEGVLLDAPAVADAVRWYTDLALVHGVMLPSCWTVVDAETTSNAVCWEKVREWEAAMWSTHYYGDPDMYVCDYEEMQAWCDGVVGVAVFPKENGPVAPAWLSGYLMSAGTVYPQESWRWLRFLTRRRLAVSDYDLAHSPYPYYLPARRSVAEESGYFDLFDEETRQVIRVAAEHVYFTPSTEARYQLDNAVRAVFDGAEVEEALREAQAALEQPLAEESPVTPVPVVVATPQPGGTSVDFAPPFSADQAAYRSLAGAYNVEHAGDVQVRVVEPSRAESADCFGGALDLDYESGREGRLNLQAIVDGDAGFSLDDFHPRFLDAARYQGDLWALPIEAQVRVMFYNRDLFDAAGEPYPAPGWTLDEFLARALALTEGSGDEQVYGFVPLSGHAIGLRIFLGMQGVQLWDEENRPRFDAPDVVAAVRWYADLALAHGVTPVLADDVTEWVAGYEEREALVREGRVAMWTGYAGGQEPWLPGIEVGMAPLPLRETGAQGVTSFSYEGLFIADDAAELEACWEWIEHLSAQAEVVSGLPARASVLESPGFAARVGEDAVATYRASLEYADLWDTYLTTPEANEQVEALNQALADILAGVDPEAALAEAQARASD